MSVLTLPGDRTMRRRSMSAADLVRAAEAYNRNQLRIPAGYEGGGRWASTGAVLQLLRDGGDADAAARLEATLVNGRPSPDTTALLATLARPRAGRTGRGTRAAAQGPAPAPTDEQVASRVEAAVRRLEEWPGGWVPLAQLRKELGDIPREDLDRVLRAMDRRPDVSLVPEANQKTIRGADRDAALRIGNQDNHIISIEQAEDVERAAPPQPAPPPTTATKATPAELMARIDSASTMDEATQMLAGSTVADLRAIARARGVPTLATTRAGLVRELVQMTPAGIAAHREGISDYETPPALAAAASPAVAQVARAQAARLPIASHVVAIQAAPSSNQIARYLDEHPMTVPELRQIMDDLQVVGGRSGTKAQLRRRIADGVAAKRTVAELGSIIDQAAPPPPPPAPPAPRIITTSPALKWAKATRREQDQARRLHDRAIRAGLTQVNVDGYEVAASPSQIIQYLDEWEAAISQAERSRA